MGKLDKLNAMLAAHGEIIIAVKGSGPAVKYRRCRCVPVEDIADIDAYADKHLKAAPAAEAPPAEVDAGAKVEAKAEAKPKPKPAAKTGVKALFKGKCS